MNRAEHWRTAEALLRYQSVDYASDVDEQGVAVPFYPDTQDIEGNGTEEPIGQNALLAALTHAILALGDDSVAAPAGEEPTP